jgi:acyl-CoA thioester hydrolase
MSSRSADAARWPHLAGRMEGSSHRLPVRVYYEDTDFSGFVYHANYLKFCERGRSDWLRLLGLHHHELMRGDNVTSGMALGFVVRKLEAEFFKPAIIDDVLEVETSIISVTGARLNLLQTVWRDDTRLFEMKVTVAMVDGNGRPQRFAKDMLDRFSERALEP